MKRLPVYLLAVLTTPVMAWSYGDDDDAGNSFGSTNISEQRLGSFTYGSGQVGGQNYNSFSQRLGDFEYKSGQIGSKNFNCTTQYLGQQAYTNCY